MKKHFSKLRGFTLIELLVVIAIIALLTGIVITSLTGSKAKARDAKRISDIGNIQLALELYFDRCKTYPDKITGDLTKIKTGCPTTPSQVSLASFISVMPTPPSSSPIAYDYAYYTDSSGNVTDYVLHAKLESYNEVIKDSLLALPTYTSGTWTPTPLACPSSNASPNTDYCRGPK